MEEKNRNPEMVVDAVIAAPGRLKELTVFRYAALEKIGSPFLDGSMKFTVENLVPTVYVMSAEVKDLRQKLADPEALRLDALEWADENVRLEDLPALLEEAAQKFQALNKAAPRAPEKPADPKKN